jgi:hypothetical protein
LDHQVDVSLYLMEVTALHHSKELDGITPSLCTLWATLHTRLKAKDHCIVRSLFGRKGIDCPIHFT